MHLVPEEARKLRLRAQRLHPRAGMDGLIDVVSAVIGVNAQSIPAMRLALRARVDGLTIGEVDAAIRERRVARTWLMRGTLHLAAAQDIGWLIGLLGPTFAAGGRRRRLELGLDDQTTARGVMAIREMLREAGSLTRAELVNELDKQGFALDPKSQAPIHLIGLAALEGVICYGADREDGKEMFVLLDDWIERGEALSNEAALVELARRYVNGYGPASAQDFAAWSGLKAAQAKAAWQALADGGEIVEARAGNLSLWVTPAMLDSAPDSASPVVNLLPAFDTLILGYANRDLVVDPAHGVKVYHGGQTVPVVLIDGRAAGVWRAERRGKQAEIAVHAFEAFDAEIWELVAGEAADIGQLWEMPVSVKWV